MNKPGCNGAYSVCIDCGRKYGTNLHKAMGVWQGQCAICGKVVGVTDAWHDWMLTDAAVEIIVEARRLIKERADG